MDKRLKACGLRLDRADEHLAFLDPKIRSLLRDVDSRRVGHFDPQTSEYVFSIEGAPPPLDWGIRVSEIAHHTRAALDNLIWALIEKRGGTPRPGVSAFPILDEEGDWKPRKDGGRHALRLIAGVSAEDRALIEACQPYQYRFHDPTSDPADDDSMVPFHPLHRLRELNNADKHRFLIPSLIAPASGQPVRADGVFIELDPIKDVASVDVFRLRYVTGVSSDDRTEFARVPITTSGPNPEVEMKTNPAFVVSLGGGSPFIIYESIRDSVIYVREQVIERLSPAFDD